MLALPYQHTLLHFLCVFFFFFSFLKCCVSQGHVALTDTEGQTETSEDMPFYVRESWSWSERERGMEGSAGRFLQGGGEPRYGKPS